MAHYSVVALVAKLVVFAIIQIPFWIQIGNFVLEPLSNHSETLELILAMLIFPFVINVRDKTCAPWLRDPQWVIAMPLNTIESPRWCYFSLPLSAGWMSVHILSRANVLLTFLPRLALCIVLHPLVSLFLVYR